VSNLVLWATIVAFVTGPLLSIVQQSKWSNRVRSVVMFAWACVAGAGTAYFQGDLTGRRFVEAGMVILVGGIAVYHGFWKPTGVSPKIEEVTDLPDTG
jgi:Na+/H+-translocating membrane pyrophosphatase